MFLRIISLFYAAKSALAALVFIALVNPSWAAYTVVDAVGNKVHFDKAPQRIVTLLPSLAETVCALDACDRIVGRDRYTVWPPEMVQRVPDVGGGLDPRIEAIVALRPDVVLISASSRVSERLRHLGLRVVVLEPKTLDQVRDVMAIVGQVLGLPPSKAAQVWQRMDASISRTAAQIPPALRGKRLYFEVSRGPYAAGATSFIGELITRMGLGNIVDKNMGPFPKLNPEFVVLKNPDFILAGDRSAGEMQLYPGWRHLPAVKNEQFCLFTLEQMDVLIHPGPRMDESAQIIRDCVLGKLKVQSRRQPQPAKKPGM